MRPRAPEKRGRPGYKILYGLVVCVILGGWAYAFRSYFDHYDSLHPDITWAVPWVQVDVIRANGVFLWNETPLFANRAGAVQYPNGRGPYRVAKGAVVARIISGSGAWNITAPVEGYFVAGMDGHEDDWRYSSLWPGMNELPAVPPLRMIEEGAKLKQGDPVGKLVPQPQELRFIGYADLTGNLEEKLAVGRIMVMMDEEDTPSRADVRVYEVLRHRAKLYVNLPWFPPEMLLSRNYSLLIETGEASGVAVPESAVTMRGKRRGVFVLRGSEAFFSPVQGRVVDGGRFMVTEGLKLGDAVIVNGQNAREGRVKLW